MTFLWSLLPLFIFNRLYPQVRLAAPFERWHCQSSHPKSSHQLSHCVIRKLCMNLRALIESFKHSRNMLPNKQMYPNGKPNKRLYNAHLWHIIHVFNLLGGCSAVEGSSVNTRISVSLACPALKLAPPCTAVINSREQGTGPSL